jgi:putative ABC transport system permease protein
VTDAARAGYRILTRLLPRDVRQRAGREFEEAALACLGRERARLGPPGVVVAWMRLTTDAVTTAVALRLRRPRRPVGRFSPDLPPPPRRGAIERTMDNLINDLRYTLRGLRRQPGFTAVTVITLALGIGANTAIFSVVSGVLLRPLPYSAPDRLEFITSQFPDIGFARFWVSPPEFLEFRDHNAAFSSVGAYATDAVNLGTSPPTRPVMAAVTPEFMPTLGVRPFMGRWFTAADAVPGVAPVAILSYDLWQRDYAGDPAILERAVIVDNVSTRIVGVMPPGYDIHDQKVEIWTPLGWTPQDLAHRRGNHFLYLVGRLKDGVTLAQARADLDGMLAHWPEFVEYGSGHVPNATRHRLQIEPLKEDIVGGVRTALLMLQGAVVFVLLIACANLANLLLARAESRQREFAVRAALGAGRRRLLGQFVTEGLVIALLAAVAGVGLAWGALRVLLRVNPDALPRSASVGLDWRVLAFTLLLAMATGVVFGLAPLLHAGSRLATALRDGTRATGHRLQRIVRGTLVIGEVTFAVMLVVGAGLMVRSFLNLLDVDLGFNRSHLATFQVVQPMAPNLTTPEARVAWRVRVTGLFDRLQARLAALPGVQGVTAMSGLPPNRPVDANDTDFEWIPNMRPKDDTTEYPIENVDYWQYVNLDYAATMGIPVVEGRSFRAGDAGGPPVVLVNEALVRRFFRDRDPIGQRLKPGGGDEVPWFTVVGVLKDVKQGGVDAPAGTEIYLLEDQLTHLGVQTQMNFVLRTSLPLASLARPIHEAVQQLDPTLPVVKLRTMDEVVGEAVARPRLLVVLLGIFAGLALVLAAVGTYGVLSYLVTRQQQEIGIRMALGADRGAILRHFLGRGLTLAGVGLAVGLAGSIGLTRLIRTLLFGVTPTDPATLVLVTVAIALVAAAACLVPAWRATRVDPLVVLRES